MTIKINGTNTTAQPSITGADTDTGLVYGTDEVQVVTGGTTRATVDSSGNAGIGSSTPTSISGYSGLTLNNATNGGFVDLQSNGTTALRLLTNGSVNNIETRTATPLVFLTNGNEAARIDSSGNVGIGISSPAYPLEVAQNTNDDSFALQLRAHTTGADGARTVGIRTVSSNAGDWANLRFDASSFIFRHQGVTERMRIQSGGGISFNGDTAAANALDDYEEGTFTPAFSGGLSFSSYNSQIGVYTKIGSMVIGTIRIDGDSVTSQTSTQISITGLPFAAANFANGAQPGGADPFYQNAFFNSNDFAGIVVNNSNQINLHRRSDGTDLTGTSVNGGREIRLTFSYRAA